MLVDTDIVITHNGKLLGIPSIILNEDDANAVPLLAKYGFKYSSCTLSPECCDLGSFSDKKVGFNSYHELSYLIPYLFIFKIEFFILYYYRYTQLYILLYY